MAISNELIQETIEIFQPYYEERLTEKDAIEMINNAGRLMIFLYELDSKHKGGEKDE